MNLKGWIVINDDKDSGSLLLQGPTGKRVRVEWDEEGLGIEEVDVEKIAFTLLKEWLEVEAANEYVKNDVDYLKLRTERFLRKFADES